MTSTTEQISKIKANGPTRTVTELESGCVKRADCNDRAADLGIIATTVFIRKDGWSLGCTARTEHAAYKLWEGEWDCRVCLLTGAVLAL